MNKFHAWSDRRFATLDNNLRALNNTVATNFKLQAQSFETKLAEVNNTADLQSIKTTLSGIDFDRLKSILAQPQPFLSFAPGVASFRNIKDHAMFLMAMVILFVIVVVLILISSWVKIVFETALLSNESFEYSLLYTDLPCINPS